ncbi:MAG: class B sortase, partial [Clostridia bacterium]|nr:class B sortase [Clostridia bacterium]
MEFLKNKKVQASLVILIICCVAGIFTYYWRINHQEEKLRDIQVTFIETEEPAPPEPVGRQIDFEALKKENPDIYAWIEIPGTVIDYPMLQSGADKAEDYYLNHNLDYSAGYPGCIYTQRRNKQDFSDPDTVIYGHNMKNDTMFGILNEYKNKDFFTEHNQIIIYTPEKTYKYRI